MEPLQIIISFLEKPVPTGGTQNWRAWVEECKSLPALAPKVFVKFLKVGTKEQQYASLLGLRQWGYEAVADDDERGFFYKIRTGENSEMTIFPRKNS